MVFDPSIAQQVGAELDQIVEAGHFRDRKEMVENVDPTQVWGAIVRAFGGDRQAAAESILGTFFPDDDKIAVDEE